MNLASPAGFKPATSELEIPRSILLSYEEMEPLAGFEPATRSLGNRYAIQLRHKGLAGPERLERSYPDLEAGVLPLNDDPKMVGVEGFEPSAPRSQAECSGQTELNSELVRPVGFEPTTSGFGARRSLRMSYGRFNRMAALYPVELQNMETSPHDSF